MSTLDRRSMLGYSALGAGLGLAGLPSMAEAAPNIYAHDGVERWLIDDTSAVADTECGKVMGYIRGDIRIFKGVPYGQVLKPEDRWKRSAKVTPWAGKRSARAPGPICPAQDISAPIDEVALRDSDLMLSRSGEDCLRLNIWTPGLDGKKRNVLFYCHGGGFGAGSALMAARYEAHNLSKYGDVVVVSLTHRLNALGFLNLTAYGPRYADSANLGMLDVVDALKWVKTNIANFGGDPAKVMIFGHSGGGAKVLTLLSMPEAKGLFNRAVSHSPGPMPFSTPDQSAALAATYLKMVGVSGNNLDALYKMPVDRLVTPAVFLNKQYQRTRELYAQWHTPENVGWRPTVDGKTVLYQPTSPTVAEVPLMTGTTLHELYGALGHPEYASMKETEARGIVRGFFGPVGDGIYDTYKNAFPKSIPYEITAMARATGSMRAYIVKAAQRRAALNGAPTYNYWLQWRANTFEGRAMSHHEIEMPLVFMNSDAVPTTTGGGADARALSVKMTDAWLAFARSGNPGTAALPHWNPVTPKTLNTMVFNNDCHIDHDTDLAAIESFWKDRFPKA